MTIIYIDSVFVLNAVMDYFLFLMTAHMAGIILKRRRYLLASVLGGAYAAAVFLPGLLFLSRTPAKIAVGVLLALTAFGGERQLLRLTILFFAISCALAGCVLALGQLSGSNIPMENGIFYTDVNVTVLLLSASAAYFVLTVVFRAAARHSVRGELISVRLCLGEKIIGLTALLDSGNDLRDPVSGDPVLVIDPCIFFGIFPKSLSDLLTAERLRFPADLLEPLRARAPELCFRLMPYQAVGTSSGLLLTLKSDWMEICGERRSGVRIALSPTELGGDYSALWGGEIGTGGVYGHHRVDTEAVDSTGAASAECHSLYRRQRHAAAAAESGEGSGAAEPDRR